MTRKTTRRTLLAGTTAALTGLSGCSALGGSDSGDAGSGGEAAGDSLVTATDETTGYGIDLGGNPVMGSSEATVDVYYWGDFQCAFCSRFEANTLPKLVENYVRPERVRVVFLELPNIGEASFVAARMAKCVWRQVRESDPGAYRRWHVAVFDAQERPDSGWASKDNLLDIARSVDGIDASGVESCMQSESDWTKSAVDADAEMASKSGISATPGFVLYNTDADKAGKIVGAQPYERFEESVKKVENA